MSPEIDGTQENWLSCDSGERLIAARQAVAGRDPDRLWMLTSAYLAGEQVDGRPISAHTLHTYRMGVRKFLKFIVEESVELDDLPHMQVYADWLAASGHTPMTMRTRVTAAQHLVRALQWAGIENDLALQRVRFPKHQGQQQNRRAYTNDEVARLLRHADVETRVMVLLGVEAAFKPAEMLDLRVDEVRQDLIEGGHLHIYRDTPEGRVPVGSVEVSRDLAQALEHWAAVRERMEGSTSTANRFLLSGRADYIEDKLRRLCQRADVQYEGAGVEGLRITAGARFYARMDNKVQLRDFLRMSSSKGLEKYILAAWPPVSLADLC